MATTWQLFKDIAKKKLSWQDEPADKPRIDKNLPLGIRIGSMLTVSIPELILAADKLKITAPVGNLTVIAYGKFSIKPFNLHRFYVADNEDNLYTLQVITKQSDDSIDEVKLFSLYDEVFTDDWGFWLDKKEGYIGYSLFDLKDGTRYLRDWSNDLEEVVLQENADLKITHIPPLEFREIYYSNPYGEKMEVMEHQAMQYGREVEEQVDEYLLVSAADKSGEYASIQIMVGLPVEPASIKVLF